MPDDVADDQATRRRRRQHVVPVAADRDADGAGQVAGGDAEPGQLGQLGREQAALQDVGHLVLGLVQPRPVQRLGALPGQREHGGPLLCREGRAPVREAQRDRAPRGRVGPPRTSGTATSAPASGPLPSRPVLSQRGSPVRVACAAGPGSSSGSRRTAAGTASVPRAASTSRCSAGAQQHRGGARAQPGGVVQDDLGDVDEAGRAGQCPDDLAELLGGPSRRALRGQQPGALQRLRAQLGENGQRRACRARPHVAGMPAEPDDAEARARRDQRDAVDGVAARAPPTPGCACGRPRRARPGR